MKTIEKPEHELTTEAAHADDETRVAERARDERLMRRALDLAARGRGQVSPGPLVGCVIADDAGDILGEGYYLYERLHHAERLALDEAGERARGATAYVTLEPHAHHGRTPPCTDALINAGITRVVAPVEDPNPLVSGKGFAALRRARVELTVGTLAREASQLNEIYNHSYEHARPFVHLKLATSLDGRIATRTGDARWITGEESRRRAHELRHEADAILVGSGTALADDPLLSDRSGLARHRPLQRIILDDRLRLTSASQLARTARDIPTLVFTHEHASVEAAERRRALEDCGVQIVLLANGARDLDAVLAELHARTLRSVLVEGGAEIAGAFLDRKLVDKVTAFIAPLIIGGRDATPAIGGTGSATLADAVRLARITHTRHSDDLEITGYPEGR